MDHMILQKKGDLILCWVIEYVFYENKIKKIVGLTVKFEPLRLQMNSCVSGIEKCIFLIYYICRSSLNFDICWQREKLLMQK